jgi:hypothetical protein
MPECDQGVVLANLSTDQLKTFVKKGYPTLYKHTVNEPKNLSNDELNFQIKASGRLARKMSKGAARNIHLYAVAISKEELKKRGLKKTKRMKARM